MQLLSLSLSVALACDEKINLWGVTVELSERLEGPAATADVARGVVERVRQVDAALACLDRPAEPSGLTELYVVGARAAVVAGDAPAQLQFLTRTFAISPEARVSDTWKELRRDTVDGAKTKALATPRVTLEALENVRIDGQLVRAGATWDVTPGVHLLQWQLEGSMKGQLLDVDPESLAGLEGSPVRARRRSGGGWLAAGAGITLLGGAGLLTGIELLDARMASPDGVDAEFNQVLNPLIFGSAGAVVVGTGLMVTPLLVQGTF